MPMKDRKRKRLHRRRHGRILQSGGDGRILQMERDGVSRWKMRRGEERGKDGLPLVVNRFSCAFVCSMSLR
jgi:hypothetical protein